MTQLDWKWDESKVEHFEGEQAQQVMNTMLMEAAGNVDTVDEALHILTQGRPRVQETDDTVTVNTRFPKTWVDWLDTQAEKLGITRSQLLRNITYNAMHAA